MTRSRRARVERLVPGLLTLFLVATVAPRAVLFTHRHDGAAREHVHGWGADATAERRPAIPQHRDGRPAIAASDHAGWHTHLQPPFQTSDATAAPQLVCIRSVADVVQLRDLRAGSARLACRTARAPPALRSA